MDTTRQRYMDSLRKDVFENTWTGQNTSCDKSRQAKPTTLELAEDDLGRFYQTDDIAQKIVDKPVKAAFQAGFDLMPNQGKRYEFFWRETKRLHILDAFKLAWRWGRLYGDSIVLMNIDDGQDPREPVNQSAIRKIKWAHVLAKTDYDIAEIGKDPNEQYFRRPSIYRLYAQTHGRGSASKRTELETLMEVHASRVIPFHGHILPWDIFQANDYMHESVLQSVWKPVANYEAGHESIAKALAELRQDVVKIPGLMEIVASGDSNLAALQRRLLEMKRTKSTHNTILIDSEESYDSSILALGGAEAILKKLEDRVVQVSNMPHTLVLGEGSEGNTSGRTESADWQATVKELQEEILQPRLEYLSELLFSQNGAPAPETKDGEPVSEEFRFEPLSHPTDEEKSQTYKTVAEADNIYLQSGVITPQEVALSRFTPEGFKLDLFIDNERLEEWQEMEEDLRQATEDSRFDDEDESFAPPESVAKAAAKGLQMRSQFGRGGTSVGIARARDLKNRKNIPIDTIGRMVSFFARHEQNKSGETKEGEPSNGTIAWLLWGGDPGRKWAERIWEDYQHREDAMEIQTLIFSKGQFSESEVQQWIKENGFKFLKAIDETETSYRVRQIDPDKIEGKMRTITLAPGIKAVVGMMPD